MDMCTSFTFSDETSDCFLARTMDFSFELEERPVFIPRNYSWEPKISRNRKTTYSFIGTGRKLTNYLVTDGVNEKGLAVAELYFPNEAKYHAEMSKKKLNFCTHELIMWLLGEIANIEELKDRLSHVQLVEETDPLLGLVLPLHFMVTDSTGETIVIETNSGELEIKDNPVGVMTNSPEFEWHLKNLNNYLTIQPENISDPELGNYQLRPFGNGAGTFGLPGGFTSPERFVRAAYLRNYTKYTKNSEESANTLFHMLKSVSMTKGLSIKADGSVSYTQYCAVFDVKNRRYYFSPYHTQEVFLLTLSNQLAMEKTAKEFDVSDSFVPTKLG